MRLKEFSVQGYKNLRQRVTLSDLGAVNIIHGENNVGKSNVLEAMNLFFKLLQVACERGLSTPIPPQDLERFDYYADELFNLENPVPVELSATIELDDDDLAFSGLNDDELDQISKSIEAALTIKAQNGGLQLHVHQFDFGLGQDPAKTTHWSRFATDLARHLTENRRAHSDERGAFVLIEESRRIRGSDETRLEMLGAIPQELRLELYDAKEALDPASYRSWDLFTKSMELFSSQLGEGRFVALYDRKGNKANLAWETSEVRIPVDLLGSGVQQVAGLVGRLIMSGAHFVAIEEPELNLRYTSQLQLRDVLRAIVDDADGPSQLFLTSHSPAFETGDDFFALARGEDGFPTIHRRLAAEARRDTAMDVVPAPVSAHAPLSYVTSEGLVMLPDSVQEKLGITSGGGVTFVTNPETGYQEILSDAQFLQLLGDGDGEHDDQ